MDAEARIVAAITELERWEARREKARERRRRGEGTRDELRRIDEQIAHYRALLRDMKQDLHPGRLARTLARRR